jgi:mannosyltransferase OCH1-like enzyme
MNLTLQTAVCLLHECKFISMSKCLYSFTLGLTISLDKKTRDSFLSFQHHQLSSETQSQSISETENTLTSDRDSKSEYIRGIYVISRHIIS